MSERLVTTRELAELLRTSEREVVRLAGRGDIPGYKVGNQWRYRVSEVLETTRQKKEGTGWNRPPVGIADPPVLRRDRHGAA